MIFQKTRCKRAIRKGLAFLDHQVLSGRYGLSCVGLTGESKFSDQKGHLFSIYFMLNGMGCDISELVRTIFLTRILSEESNGRWGYSPRAYYVEDKENPYFVDTDDTAFALRSLRIMGLYRKTDAFDEYLAEVRIQGRTVNLFRTFLTKQVPEVAVTPSPMNNLLLHPEVNANILQFFIGTEKEGLLEEQFATELQNSDGLWPSYFYPLEFYGTYMFVSLLVAYRKADGALQKAVEGINALQNADGSFGRAPDPLTTSLALRILQLADYHGPQVQAGRAFLLKKQKFSGHWSSKAAIWKFHHEDGDVWTAYDTNHVVTTAMCIAALRESVS